MKKFFIALFVVLIVGGIALGAYLFLTKPKPVNLGIEAIYPEEIFAGKPFEFKVSISNYANHNIENAKISLVLPEGITVVGQDANQRVTEESLGDIQASAINPPTIFNLIAAGTADSVKKITINLKYRIPNNQTDFETSKEAVLNIGRSSAELTIEMPQKVFSGEDFDIKVKYKNISEEDLAQVGLKFNYPPTFQFKKSTVDPSDGQNAWDLGALAKGASGELTITGALLGNDGAGATFDAALSAEFEGKIYDVAKQSIGMNIATSPLVLNINTEGVPDSGIAERGDQITYVLQYKNNSTITLENLRVTAQLSGEMIDFSTVSSEGFLDSNNVITWTPATNPGLAAVTAGAGGNLRVTLKLRSDFPLSRMSDKNFTVKVQAQAVSPTVPPGTASNKTIALASSELKLGGYLELDTVARFKDADSGILNTGVYPPRVNKATQYTVHWVVRNYATDAKDVRVVAKLQSGAKFTGKVKSTIGPVPEYNAGTQEVYWNIGDLAATKGIVGGKLEAIFQIEQTPAVNQVGKLIPLLSESDITGTDTFTNQPMEDSTESVTLQNIADLVLGQDRTVKP